MNARHLAATASLATIVLLIGTFVAQGLPTSALPSQEPAPSKSAEVDLTPPLPATPAPGPGSLPALPDGVHAESLRRLAGPTSLDLEDSVLAAELVLIVRLLDVTESVIVYGGKQEVTTHQYRFEPVRTLKGVYARDALLMTGQDLRITDYTPGQQPLKAGQLLLLMLGRSGPGFFNCSSAGTLEQSIPRLDGQDDPLVQAVEVLIRVTQQPDRLRRVELLRDGLASVQGRAALPLLASLRRRALLASRDPEIGRGVASRLDDERPISRQAAADTLAAILSKRAVALDRPVDPEVVARLVAALALPAPDVQARVAVLDAARQLKGDVPSAAPVSEALAASSSRPTIAEQAAWLRASAAFAPNALREPVWKTLESLPLDAPDELVRDGAGAASSFDPARAARWLTGRASARLQAGLAIPLELTLLGDLPAEHAAPSLVAISAWPLSPDEQLSLSNAAAGRASDPSLVPVLSRLLDPSRPGVRYAALHALLKIDGPDAAAAVWPHLAEESDLGWKLRLSSFVGRHGYRGGYPFAIEHMSDPNLRDLAIDALGKIRHPDAPAELRQISQSSNDLGWSASAIRALGRLGVSDDAPNWLAIAADPSNPLASSAMLALADLSSTDVIPSIRAALDSRADADVIAAARSTQSLGKGSVGLAAVPLLDRLAELLADRRASLFVRGAALDALLVSRPPSLAPSLESAVRDASLEGTPLLDRIEDLVRGAPVPNASASE